MLSLAGIYWKCSGIRSCLLQLRAIAGPCKTIDYGEMGAGEEGQPAQRREGLTERRPCASYRRGSQQEKGARARSLGVVDEGTDWHEEIALL